MLAYPASLPGRSRSPKGSIKVGDTVAITATVRKRVTEDRVSVLIPTYSQPHSIVDRTPHISSGQKIELTGEVTRVDDDTVTVDNEIRTACILAGARKCYREASQAAAWANFSANYRHISAKAARTLTGSCSSCGLSRSSSIKASRIVLSIMKPELMASIRPTS